MTLFARPRALPSVLAGPIARRYSLPVRIIRSSLLIACAGLVAACAQSKPQVEILAPTRVLVSRLVSEEIPPRPADCTIETLAARPAQPYRELGTIAIPGGDLGEHNTRAMIDQNACAMGADAIVIDSAHSDSHGRMLEAVAIAYSGNLAARAAQPPAASADGSAAPEPPPHPLPPVPPAQAVPPARALPPVTDATH